MILPNEVTEGAEVVESGQWAHSPFSPSLFYSFTQRNKVLATGAGNEGEGSERSESSESSERVRRWCQIGSIDQCKLSKNNI